MQKQLLLYLLILFIGLAGCNDNPSDSGEDLSLASVYVTNEGNFSDANGSLTSYNPLDGSVIQQTFKNVNGRSLAGTIQSAAIIDEYLFIVLNSTNKIEVVDARSFTSVATIEMETTPVGIAPAGADKAYVTNLYSHNVSVINLESFEVSGTTIDVGTNPQDIITMGSHAYVANNGFGNDNTITVINTGNDSVIKTLTVGFGPTDLASDSEDRIWVVCNGRIAYDEDFNRDPENDIPGSVYIIDGNNAKVISSINVDGHPRDIAIDDKRNRAYLINDGVEIINTTVMSLEDSKLTSRDFNAVGYSPEEEMIYLAQSKGYTQPGQVIRFNLQGAAVDSFAAGIGPNGFYFVEN